MKMKILWFRSYQYLEVRNSYVSNEVKKYVG
jgi:hypothetical protein